MPKEGLVIAHLGQGIAVEFEEDIILCQPLRRLETITVGDRVMWSLSAPGLGRIESVLPRRSVLTRPSRNNKIRPVAANIDMVFVVVATQPFCDFLLVDQYLAVCENSNIDVHLIYNKIDLPRSEPVEKELTVYKHLGYVLHYTSTLSGQGIPELETDLTDKVSIFTGQSGVGKSSLTQLLLPDKDIRINAISETTKHGRHTTTAATLFHLANGGDLIDSPGVSIFGLSDLDTGQIAQGYREFQPYISNCQFNDCKHLIDKGCAVRDAVEAGMIDSSRYQRYQKLVHKMIS